MNAQMQPSNEIAKLTSPQMPIRDYHEFYRFYLTEHRHIMSRRLHFAGSSIGLYFLARPFVSVKPNIWPMDYSRVMPVPGLVISFLKRINRPALNNRFTVLFQTGVCLPMYYVVT